MLLQSQSHPLQPDNVDSKLSGVSVIHLEVLQDLTKREGEQDYFSISFIRLSQASNGHA